MTPKPPPKLNADWHRAHRMPEKATLEQRVAWHREHQMHCACRPTPASVLAAMTETHVKPKAPRRATAKPSRGV
jgi:hypothetical protein